MAQGGATPAPDAFAMASVLSTPLYDYALHRGGMGSSNPESWYLRSSYRRETSLYASVTPLAQLYGFALLDTLHERVGDAERLRNRQDLRNTRWVNGGWGRAVMRFGNSDSGG